MGLDIGLPAPGDPLIAVKYTMVGNPCHYRPITLLTMRRRSIQDLYASSPITGALHLQGISPGLHSTTTRFPTLFNVRRAFPCITNLLWTSSVRMSSHNLARRSQDRTPAGHRNMMDKPSHGHGMMASFQLFHYDTYIRSPVHPSNNLATLNIRILRSRSRCSRMGIRHGPGKFDWVATSRFFNPRKLHNEFLDYFNSLVASAESKKHFDVHAIQDETLVLFGKRKELDDACYRHDEGSRSHWNRRKNGDWREEMIKLSDEERKELALWSAI